MATVFDRRNWAREIHLVGLGGIGSWVALWLLKHGVPELHVYDHDIVEPHNTYCQLWRHSEVGMFKTQALNGFAASEQSPTQIVPHSMRVKRTSQVDLRGVVISAVDSMESRAAIWELVKFNPLVELYMDGRIGGDEQGDDFHLYTLNPSNPSQIDLYEAWMYSGDDASPTHCAVRDDFHSGIVLSGWITKNLALLAQGKRPAEILHGDLSIVAVPGGATPVVQIP